MMIFISVSITLLISLFLPWFYVAAFAAMLATAQTFDVKKLILTFLFIWASHSVVAVLLDQLANGRVGVRIGSLLALPHFSLLYLATGLSPAILFLTTVWVVDSGRKLVKRKV